MTKDSKKSQIDTPQEQQEFRQSSIILMLHFLFQGCNFKCRLVWSVSYSETVALSLRHQQVWVHKVWVLGAAPYHVHSKNIFTTSLV